MPCSTVNGRQLSPQKTLTALPDPTGLPLERTQKEFASVPQGDIRTSLIEIWEEHAELTKYYLDGKLPSSGAIYEILEVVNGGLRPPTLERLWAALQLGLDLPLEINRGFLSEQEQMFVNSHNSHAIINLERILISQIVQAIQATSRQLLLVFINMIPELEILAWTLEIWRLPRGLESIPLEDRAHKVLEVLEIAQAGNTGDHPIIPTFMRAHFITGLLATKSVELCRLYSELFDHLPFISTQSR